MRSQTAWPTRWAPIAQHAEAVALEQLARGRARSRRRRAPCRPRSGRPSTRARGRRSRIALAFAASSSSGRSAHWPVKSVTGRAIAVTGARPRALRPRRRRARTRRRRATGRSRPAGARSRHRRCTTRGRRPRRCRPSRPAASVLDSRSRNWVIEPCLTMIISSCPSCRWKAWPSPGSSVTSMTTSDFAPVFAGRHRHPIVPQSNSSWSTSACLTNRAHHPPPCSTGIALKRRMFSVIATSVGRRSIDEAPKKPTTPSVRAIT